MSELGTVQSRPKLGAHFHAGKNIYWGQTKDWGSLRGRREICSSTLPLRGISSAPFFFKCFLVKLEYAMRRQSFVAEI